MTPALGFFRIDLASASFFIPGRQAEWSIFSFLAGLALFTATVPALPCLTMGAVWCGRACFLPGCAMMAWGVATHEVVRKS